MADVSKEDMTKHLGASLNLPGKAGELGVKLDIVEDMTFNSPTEGAKVEVNKASLEKAYEKIGETMPGKEKGGPDHKGKEEIKQNLKTASPTSFSTPKQTAKPGVNPTIMRRPASQKELAWKAKIKRMLDEIAKAKFKKKPVHAAYLPNDKKRVIMERNLQMGNKVSAFGDMKDPNTLQQTAKNAGYNKKEWERWGRYCEGVELELTMKPKA
ncbi:MAG: hypothetical protein PHW76_01970 [Alphaproteobacteria bacterium]|nr:hypothetical protein [Alphaproteobacteria bacterium]